MKTFPEWSKSYVSLEDMRKDLAEMPVKETKPFPLSSMKIDDNGYIEIDGIGSYPITDIAKNDAIRRGGVHVACFQKFEEEGLEAPMIGAINEFFRKSASGTDMVKGITKNDHGVEVLIGIPSADYALFTNEQALEQIMATCPEDMELARANLYPEFMEVSYKERISTGRDSVGQVVSLGINFVNSQGSRMSSLKASAFSYRLICLNGAVAKAGKFGVSYRHMGNMPSKINFREDTKNVFVAFQGLMKNLPKLGEIPASEQIRNRLFPALVDAAGKKEAAEIMGMVPLRGGTVSDIWNAVTEAPHRMKSAVVKKNLEELGFNILTMFLN